MSSGFFELNDIRQKIAADPRGFLAECDHTLNGRITRAAAAIATGSRKRPVVLLAGPSGSGKTTTAHKLAEELEWIGVGTRVISMDNYFLTVDKETHPRNAKGEIDYESPNCLDLPLLTSHFEELTAGKEVLVPHFDFAKQKRDMSGATVLKLGKDEVAVFEGIHALNPLLLGGCPESKCRVYVSGRANVRDGSALMYKGTWLRLTRRIIRDANFRGWESGTTMKVWANVRRGEKKYISPYKSSADITIDTALPYEVPVFRNLALDLFREVPKDAERYDELCQIAPLLEQFPSLPSEWVSSRALMREFIGGEAPRHMSG
jgi:uridine kinase